MAHFAEINSDNVVQQVIVISDDVAPDPDLDEFVPPPVTEEPTPE